jgi:hypothetical protein
MLNQRKYIFLLAQIIFQIIHVKVLGCSIPVSCEWMETNLIENNVRFQDLEREKNDMSGKNESNLVCHELYPVNLNSDFSQSKSNCIWKEESSDLAIYFRNFQILTEKFEFFKMIKLSSKFHFRYIFVDLKGIDLDSTITIESNDVNTVLIVEFHRFPFDFYTAASNNQQPTLVRSCEDIANATNASFIFNFGNFGNTRLDLRFMQFAAPTCPLVFRNARINLLKVKGLINTFFKRNILEFLNWSEPLSINIDELVIKHSYGIDLDYKLLHEGVFANMTKIRFDDAYLNSIQVDVFRSFAHLQEFHLNPLNFREIMFKQGLEWIGYMNSNVNVNLSNSVEISALLNSETTSVKRIIFSMDRDFSNEEMQIAYDEDFCLFVNYPFHKLIILQFDIDDSGNYYLYH